MKAQGGECSFAIILNIFWLAYIDLNYVDVPETTMAKYCPLTLVVLVLCIYISAEVTTAATVPHYLQLQRWLKQRNNSYKAWVNFCVWAFGSATLYFFQNIILRHKNCYDHFVNRKWFWTWKSFKNHERHVKNSFTYIFVISPTFFTRLSGIVVVCPGHLKILKYGTNILDKKPKYYLLQIF